MKALFKTGTLQVHISILLICIVSISSCSKKTDIIKGEPEVYERESFEGEISEVEINQMRSMMNSAWGWKSYFPRIITCWDPTSIRVSVYDLASFPQLSYDGTVTGLSSLQLSVIVQGSSEGYFVGGTESVPEEAASLWDSFCAEMEQAIDNQVNNAVADGSFWELYKEVSSYLKKRKEFYMTILGENIFESNYTLRIIQSIRITSSSDLFGVKAGEDIGSHFVLSGRVDYRSHVWNTLDGQFERIDKPLDGMSFEEFLEYRPYMRRLEIKLKDLPEETPENLTFTISISYEDGDEVTAAASVTIV